MQYSISQRRPLRDDVDWEDFTVVLEMLPKHFPKKQILVARITATKRANTSKLESGKKYGEDSHQKGGKCFDGKKPSCRIVV